MEQRVLWLQWESQNVRAGQSLRHHEMPSGYLQEPETEGWAAASQGPLYSDGVRTKLLLPLVTITCSFTSTSLYPFLPQVVQNTQDNLREQNVMFLVASQVKGLDCDPNLGY